MHIDLQKIPISSRVNQMKSVADMKRRIHMQHPETFVDPVGTALSCSLGSMSWL